MLAVDLVMAVLILSTGSRAQVVALGIMAALVAFYQTRRLRFRTRKQKKLFEFGKWAVIFGMIALAGANYFQHTSLEQALVNSNRMGLFSINLPVLLRENKLWLGLVYASAGRFGEGRIGLYQVYYVDNYYVYLLMSSGVLGCAIQLAAIFLVVQGIRTTVWKPPTEGRTREAIPEAPAEDLPDPSAPDCRSCSPAWSEARWEGCPPR